MKHRSRRGKSKIIPISACVSPTERRNPRSSRLDQLSTEQAIRLMLSEEAKVSRTLLKWVAPVTQAVDLIAAALKDGGHLFYVGAGTSGRLGVLDASECPPTFRVAPEMIQGIIAGGHPALWRSVEGAEDDLQAGRVSLKERRVSGRDVVVGIAASGTTPFVWGALAEARRRKAATILLCFNPHLRFPRGHRPDIVIAPDLGPEVLTGSTRLKAGTATKLLLNLFSTLSMVKLGKVIGNWMVDLNPSNEKLRRRAVRITRELAAVDEDTARAALLRAGWSVRGALDILSDKSASVF